MKKNKNKRCSMLLIQSRGTSGAETSTHGKKLWPYVSICIGCDKLLPFALLVVNPFGVHIAFSPAELRKRTPPPPKPVDLPGRQVQRVALLALATNSRAPLSCLRGWSRVASSTISTHVNALTYATTRASLGDCRPGDDSPAENKGPPKEAFMGDVANDFAVICPESWKRATGPATSDDCSSHS